MLRHTLPLALMVFGPLASAATITDLTEWTQIEDPPHPNFFTVLQASDQVQLRADGGVPTGFDIGYASVDGTDVVGSTGGFYFSPDRDFHVAIDFDLSSDNAIGAGGIGFGIGEDIGGMNSAGVGLVFLNGAPLIFGSSARVDDVTQLGVDLLAGFGRGRLFVEYQAASGDVVVGVNATPGASSPAVIATLNAIQRSWDDEPLLASFFLRSQAVAPLPGLNSGTIDATFSNFQVLSGTPLRVPEPTTSLLAILGALGVLGGSPRQARGCC